MAGEDMRGDATGLHRGFLSGVGRRWRWIVGGTLAGIIGSAGLRPCRPATLRRRRHGASGGARAPRPWGRRICARRRGPGGLARLGRPRPRGGRTVGAGRVPRVRGRRRFRPERGRCVSVSPQHRAHPWIAGDRDHVHLTRSEPRGAGRQHGRRTCRSVSERGEGALRPGRRELACRQDRGRQGQGRQRRSEGRGAPRRLRPPVRRRRTDGRARSGVRPQREALRRARRDGRGGREGVAPARSRARGPLGGRAAVDRRRITPATAGSAGRAQGRDRRRVAELCCRCIRG